MTKRVLTVGRIGPTQPGGYRQATTLDPVTGVLTTSTWDDLMGEPMYTTCDDCGEMDVPITEFGAAMYCEDCDD